MKLFKKEIIIAIKIYIKEFSEQNFPDIDKEEFFNLYLSKYSKNKKKKNCLYDVCKRNA